MSRLSYFFSRPRLFVFYLIIFLFSGIALSGATKRDYFRLGRSEKLDSLGVKFRGIRDSKPMPLSAPTTFTMRRSDGVKIEAQYAYELWYHEQCLGRWGNEVGTLILCRMSLALPETIPGITEHKGKRLTVKPIFEDWKKKNRPEWNDKTRSDWLKAFTQVPFKAESEEIKRGGPRQATTRQYFPVEEDAGIWVYEIKDNKSDEEPIVFIFQLNLGANVDKSERAVGQSLASVDFYTPSRTVDTSKERDSSRSDSLSEENKADWTPEYIASREHVIRNIQNLKDWWYLPTANFIVVSNESNRKTIREIEENLEDCRNVFADFFPVLEPPKAVSVCRVFAERDEYLTYIADTGMQWSAGMWASHKKELLVSPMDFGSLKKKREMLINVIYHEGFHQYIYYVTGEQHTAIWFNEGHATFFEGIDFKTRGKYDIDPTYRYKTVNRMAQAGQLPVEKYLKIDHVGFQSGDIEANYAMVWGITYFLRKGCIVMDKEKEYGHIPSRYYDAIRQTRNPVKATQIAWEGVDLAQFTADITEFYESSAKVRKAGRQDSIKYLSEEDK